MKKFLFLFLIFGLYLNTSAQSIDLCDVLPETADIYVAKGKPVSYLNIDITHGGVLDGNDYAGWCVDTEHGLSFNHSYVGVTVHCNYDNLSGLLVNPGNLDRVNWILNNVSVGDYTMGDIQMAIWNLISDIDLLPLPDDNPGFWQYLGPFTDANVGLILADAEEYGEGYVPGANEYIAVVFNPGDNLQTFIIPFLIPVQDPGCTLTQGYWKTHGSQGPANPFDETWNTLGENTTFFLSGMSYYDAIREKAKGNAYYILAHQYIAATLNDLAGADFTDADAAFNAATALFSTYTPNYVKGLKGNNPTRQQFIAAADVLADYNEGLIGPGHCDDKSAFATFDESASEMNIYPNPMTNSGTIDFIAENEAQTTVEMYNVMGQRVATLFDSPAQMGQQYQVKIDANRHQKGLYVVYLKNGSSTVTKKININ